MDLNVDSHSPPLQPEASKDPAFDWPTAHFQAVNDTESGWATPAPGPSDDGNSSQSVREPLEGYSSAVRGSPPPVIVAFPDHGYEPKPPPRHDIDSPSIPWPIIVAVVAASIAVVVVAAAITVVLTSRGGQNPSPSTAPSTTSPAPSTVPATQAPPTTVTVTAPPVATVTPRPTATVPTRSSSPAPSVPQYPAFTSLQQLRAQANADYPAVTAFAQNQWFPQLSSKQPGIFDDGIRWDYDSIWREHLDLRRQYDAVLLWSGDWPRTFTTQPDYWVTIAWVVFPTADEVKEWCRNHVRDSHHCFPKQIQ